MKREELADYVMAMFQMEGCVRGAIKYSDFEAYISQFKNFRKKVDTGRTLDQLKKYGVKVEDK